MPGSRPIFRKCVEMAVLFGVLLAIDHGLLTGHAFAGIEPNPYWLPVLTMAMTYGTGMGLGAAMIATALWFAAPHEWGADVDHLGRQLRLSMLPMLWIIAALVIGEVAAGRKAKIAEHERRYESMERNWERMAAILARLARINRTLQIRIATEERTVGEASAAAFGLARPDPASRIAALVRLIALATQTEDFTYYEVRSNRVTALFRGQAAESRPSDLSSTPLAHAMIADPRPLRGGREADRKILLQLGLAAIPVRDSGSGVLKALLVIHASRRLRLTDAKIAELAHMAEAMGGLHALFVPEGSTQPAALESPEERVA